MNGPTKEEQKTIEENLLNEKQAEMCGKLDILRHSVLSYCKKHGVNSPEGITEVMKIAFKYK